MSSKSTTAVKTSPVEESRQVVVTRTVNVPLFKNCASHSKYFPGEESLLPISSFWGTVPGSYCKRCSLLMHKANRSSELARRQRIGEELKQYRAHREEFLDWLATQQQQ